MNLLNTETDNSFIPNEDSSTFSRMPSYLVAADNHAVANGDNSLAETISTGVSKAENFTAAAILSGANSFYNTGAAVANFLGADVEESNTHDLMAAFDDNLAAYYDQNKAAVDTAGFVIGSLIPGLGGIRAYNYGAKMLNAAKAGRIGMNMEEATGLLKVTQWEALKAAETEMTSSNATFSLLSGDTLKAVAAGIGEQAIQGAVFETAVAATMFKSPVMEQMDAGDIASNILWGSVFAGGIGGALETAASYGFLRKAKTAADLELQPVTHVSETRAGATNDARIILWKDDEFSSKAFDVAPLDEKYNGKGTRNLNAKVSLIQDKVRTAVREISNGDDVAGNMVADAIHAMKDTQEVGDKVLGLRNISRVLDRNDTEILMNSLAKKVKIGGEVSPEEEQLKALKVLHTKLWGEGVGDQIPELPAADLRIQDKLKKGQDISITQKGVKIGNGNFMKMSSHPDKSVNFMTASQDEAEAAYLWAYHTPPLAPDAIIHQDALHLLEKAYMDSASSPSLAYKIKYADGSISAVGTRKELLDHITLVKEDLKARMFKASQDGVLESDATLAAQKAAQGLPAKQLSTNEIARRLNMRTAAVERTAMDTKNLENDYLANQSFALEHNARMQAAGFKAPANPMEVLLKPQYVKMGYDTTAIKDVNGNVLEGIAAIKQQQVIFRDAAERTFASAFGATSNQFFRMPEDVTQKATTEGAGAGFLSFANGAYGTPAAHYERIGQATNKLMTQRVNDVHAVMEPLLRKISDDLPSTMELSTILSTIRGTPEKYVLSEDGTALVLRGQKLVEDARSKATTRQELEKIQDYVKEDANAPEEIPLNSEHVQAFVAQHIKTNGARVSRFQGFRNLSGLQDRVDGNTFYAPPVDPKRYPHFAFVVDNSITGTGHVKMIHAATERDLDALMARVPSEGGLRTVTKGDSERFHEAYGDYARDMALHENYIDSALHRSGVSQSYFPVTDGKKLVDDIMSWHAQKERQLVREGVSTLYSKEFNEFRNLGEQYTNLATAKYGRLSMVSTAEETVKNPYIDYIKTALDISKSSDAKMWTPLNVQLDAKVSSAWNSVTRSLLKTKSADELSIVNDALNEAGIKTAYYDAALDALANHTAPRGVLSSFVQKANALLASITLRPDVLNAVNNIVGSTILTGTEMRSVLSAIERADASAVGDLAKIRVPGTQHDILAPQKLISKAMANWNNPILRETAFRDGFTARHSLEYQSIMDDITLHGSESVSELNAKIKSAYEKTMKFATVAERLSGNKFAEEYTRFISADVMRQVTDVAVAQGHLDPLLAKSYIQTFVNRTQGNYLASQRPLMFQGPIGQAVGLFQTYQFNMTQQLLRHVAEGQKKNAALMMGLQSTIYGMNGLPAFQAINTHLVGTASGNTQHRDIYTGVYGSLNKEAADWLMYGAASNVLGLLHPDLKMNLYTRGDVNPRYMTVVPMQVADLPIINASAKFFGNVAEVMGKLGTGNSNPMVTILQGLEHNGVSRPMAGLAQTLEAFTNPAWRSYSTTASGNLSASNDLLALANLGRILGAKPLDEAIAIDFGHRKSVYQAADAARRERLGEVMRTTVIAGQHPSQDQIRGFMEDYAKRGGKQENFNKYMIGIYKATNVSQANVIEKALKTPYSKQLQQLMGGASTKDFINTPIVSSDASINDTSTGE